MRMYVNELKDMGMEFAVIDVNAKRHRNELGRMVAFSCKAVLTYEGETFHVGIEKRGKDHLQVVRLYANTRQEAKEQFEKLYDYCMEAYITNKAGVGDRRKARLRRLFLYRASLVLSLCNAIAFAVAGQNQLLLFGVTAAFLVAMVVIRVRKWDILLEKNEENDKN